MDEVRVVEILPMDMLSMSIIVLFVGMFLNRKIRVLGDNYIPPAVTGGLLFAAGTLLVYSFADVQIEFDMRMRDLLLLVFFSTVGLSARLRALAAGGKALVVLVLAAGVFLILQNTVGIMIAMGAGVVGLAFATFGLVAGGIIGGPIVRRLLERRGFAGLGLGATPVAIANMNAVTSNYGPSTKAFLVVPLVGAFFIDILNAGTINFFIRIIQNHLV